MKTSTAWRQGLVALVLAATLPSLGWAADEPERPWAKGVARDRQTKAIAMFREGNAALKESLFPKAAATYKDALQVWDHPAIHYNLALALVNLDQPVEVHEHLTAALKFGPAPLDDDKFQQAQRYLALIERQLTKIKVSCAFAGAQVRFDGRPLFTGPGEWEGQVRSGPHTLTASKEGLLPDERSVTLNGGDSQQFELKVYRAEELTEYRRAFSPLIPLAALGAGAVLVGTGVGVHFGAQAAFKEYDRGVVACAGTDLANAGCIPTPDLQAARSSAEGLQTGAYVMYGIGGAALVTSAVLFYVGRPIPFRKTVNVDASRPPQVTVVPLLSPSGAGALAAIEF